MLVFSLFADGIHKVYFDKYGNPRPGHPIIELQGNDDPFQELGEYLDFGKITVRKEGRLTYISTQEGPGVIPILCFHQLGNDTNYDLTVERFDELLEFLYKYDFHVITDKQYLNSDFSYAPHDSKLIVLGADDGGKGAFYYDTKGNINTGRFLMERGEFLISDKSMVYYLNKYLPVEEGRRNFTFYMSFDAIPFRQTGGAVNTGHPYLAMTAVKSKMDYLLENYYIGNHTQHHYYSRDLNAREIKKELIGFYEILEEYGLGPEESNILAFPYGIGEIKPEVEELLLNFDFDDVKIAGAFDFNNDFPKPFSSGEVNKFDISRYGVDNATYEVIMEKLEYDEIFTSRRAVLIDEDAYPFDLHTIDLSPKDNNYIIIRN